MRHFQLLEQAGLEIAATYLGKTVFRDGCDSAHGYAKLVKNNQEIDFADPNSQEITAFFATQLMRHPNTQHLVYPKTLTRPLISRTTEGGAYGYHVDEAQMRDIHGIQMRCDLSYTLFLSDPATYDGGELSIRTESGDYMDFKLPPGEIIFYKSGRLHEVKPVTRGERLVCIGWIESMIHDEDVRNALWSLTDLQNTLGQNVDKSSSVFQSYLLALNALRRGLMGRV